MKPRIYTYKITFPYQGWWYWGAHSEVRCGEKYNGTPTTHREKWDLFYFEKQILEFFDTWTEAKEVEHRLIRPDLNNPLCLNEFDGKHFSDSRRGDNFFGPDQGKAGGRVAVESGQLMSVRTFETCSKGGTGMCRTLNQRKYQCLVTGKVAPPGPLSRFQMARNIDTSLRIRIN